MYTADLAKNTSIPTRILGKTGLPVTCIGLGGEGVLRTFGKTSEAVKVIHRALDIGITYFDCARAYAGSEGYYGAALGARRDSIFLTSKAFERSRKGAMEQLETTLSTMKTSYLDLWQVHDIRKYGELEEISSPGGALEAFVEARAQGKVRFIGVTAHYDASVLKKALHLFDFDTVLMPLSAAHPHFKPFLTDVLPIALDKGMGIITMKVLGGTFVPERRTPGEVKKLITYSLSLPVSTMVIGCSSPGEVEMNAGFAREFKTLL
ncbi:MAG: aldo/keto reductase [Candidatus Eremiobacteraeota bacterium]|nr:aldo/keto reductase [Candidatus Eremiobacteraeota bacterium]